MTFIQKAPGVFAQRGLNVTPIEVKHYGQLVGRKIVSVQFQEFDGRDNLPIFILDDNTAVSVMSDPEGNGAGFLHIGK